MNSMTLTSGIVQSIGWTLIHTLWQAPLIYILMVVVHRTLGSRMSAVRYGVSVGALALIIVCMAATFLNQSNTPQGTGELFTLQLNGPAIVGNEIAASLTWQTALQWIDHNLVWVLRFWVVGFVFYSFRLIAGFWYVNKLKRDSYPLGAEWSDMLNNLARRFNISRSVAIAEAKVSSPMVVGYLKPVILFPIGLVAGLSAQQVETILLHELSHIRRHDYLVNIFQVSAEAVLFFNPFVWLISAHIRREREHCCDDMVLAKGIDPLTYVRTLAELEATSERTLALGIVGERNELLNRIKRIMQKSAKNDWSSGRLLPASLVVLSLVLASWLSIENSEYNTVEPIQNVVVVQDTTKPGRKETRSAKKETELRKAEEEKPEAHEQEVYSLRRHSDQDWEEFEQEFNEKFKAQFGEFFEENKEQIAAMMEALRESQENNLPFMVAPKLLEEMDHLDKLLLMPGHIPMPEIPMEAFPEAFEGFETMEIPFPQMDEFEAMRSDAFRAAEEAMKLDHEAIDAAAWAAREQDWKIPTEIMEKLREHQLFELDNRLKYMDADLKKYETELREMLIADGYINRDDPWDGLTINVRENEFNVNGIRIKDKDLAKYKASHDKYFSGSKSHWIMRTE